MDKENKSLPPCAVCAGRTPARLGKETEEDFKISVQSIIYKYPGDVRVEAAFSIRSPMYTAVEQGYRFRDLRNGAVALLHYCFDNKRLMINLYAPLPHDKKSKSRLGFFFKYVQKLHETRGRKKKVTIEDLYESIRREPGAGNIRLASDLGVSTKTLTSLIKRAGHKDLEEARKFALGSDGKK